MKEETLPLGFNRLSYDEFTWSDNARADSKEKILVTIAISKEHLFNLSGAVYQKYLEIIKEMPDYFTSWDEPFPNSKDDIYNDPKKLFLYFSKSSLWSDFLIKTISQIQYWDMNNSNYHALKVNEVKMTDGIISLVMLCVKIKI